MVPHNSHLNAIAAMALRLSLLATSAAAAAGRDDVALRGPPPPLVMPIYHVPFNVGKGGCCADINAITEYKGVKHMFKQSGGVQDPTSKGLGFAHYVSSDFVRWKYLSTIVTPGGADGSLSFLPDGPVILWDCTGEAACKATSEKGLDLELVLDEHPEAAAQHRGSSPVVRSGGCRSGDAAIIGVARPADPADAKLEKWVKAANNPITVGPPGTACYAGPSNLWPRADGKGTNLVMIYNTTTGLFKSTDKTLHDWSLENGNFYPTRGGGGGLFFRLPNATGAAPSAPRVGVAAAFTHMLQSDFPGKSDGSGKKTSFATLRQFILKLIILPRQARDKHRENSKKTRDFS
jgi:hypothetical protein